MKSIGIVGSGIAGLQLGLFLQKHGASPVIYSDKSPDQIRETRLSCLVIRFAHTLERERALGVDHWNFPDFGIEGVHMNLGIEAPITWIGSMSPSASAVDMRIYQSTLLEDFAERGGKVVIENLSASDVTRLSDQHDLMVVASGRGSLAEMFARDPERSPYSHPMRHLTGAFFRGLDFPNPLGVVQCVSPGNGEIFQAPFMTFSGRVCSLLFEGIPGQAFEVLMQTRYEDNPQRFDQTVLELLRAHAPAIYAKVNEKEFGAVRAQDVIQGAITPTVRRGYAALGNGKFALATGDLHILNDPIIAQGANTASRCAERLSGELLKDVQADEAFCRETAEKLWQAGRAATEWTNLMLQAPPPHVLELFVAAAQNQALADELVQNFDSPERNLENFGSPAGAAACLSRHTH